MSWSTSKAKSLVSGQKNNPQPATLPEEPSVDYFEPPYKETKEEEDTELSYEDVDGFVRNARFNSMGLVEKENDLEKEERFKIYKIICWNMILNRVKYHLCMN